jgi:cephalosporin hydroxylase
MNEGETPAAPRSAAPSPAVGPAAPLGITPTRTKVVGGLLLLAVAAGPVLIYDRLVAREISKQSRRNAARAKRPPALARQSLIDEFHKLFYSTPSTWANSRWLGVRTAQNPNDVWLTQEIIFEVKPDVIVEAGTAYGGSAALWAMIQDQVNPAGRVVTIDIKPAVDLAALPPIGRKKVDFLVGSSTDPKIVEEVRRRVRGKRVMVTLDSDHRKSHVLAELEAYAPMVTQGSYIIVQDTCVNGHPVRPDYGPGPMEAVEEFLASDSRFEADRSREHLLFTFHPKGYLKRVR